MLREESRPRCTQLREMISTEKRVELNQWLVRFYYNYDIKSSPRWKHSNPAPDFLIDQWLTSPLYNTLIEMEESQVGVSVDWVEKAKQLLQHTKYKKLSTYHQPDIYVYKPDQIEEDVEIWREAKKQVEASYIRDVFIGLLIGYGNGGGIDIGYDEAAVLTNITHVLALAENIDIEISLPVQLETYAVAHLVCAYKTFEEERRAGKINADLKYDPFYHLLKAHQLIQVLRHLHQSPPASSN